VTATRTLSSRFWPGLVLGGLWALLVLHDRIWLAFDQGVPDWDQGRYLVDALNMSRALQHPEWWSERWWTEFWQLSPMTPPLGALAACPVIGWFGPRFDQVMLVQAWWTAVSLWAVYALGARVFDRHTARWAAVMAAVLPSVGKARLRFTLDLPLFAIVTVAFLALTYWYERAVVRRDSSSAWWLALAWGASMGAALLVKQQAAFALAVPCLWAAAATIRLKDGRGFVQCVLAAFVAALCVWPWFSSGWAFILSGGWRATAVAAASSGMAPMWSIEGWTVYLRGLPELVSWPVIASLLAAAWLGRASTVPTVSSDAPPDPRAAKAATGAVRWLMLFVVGAIFVASLSPNRQPRYLLAVVPAVLLVVSWSWSRVPGPWAARIRWATLSCVVVASLLNQWPIGGAVGDRLGAALSPYAQHRPLLDSSWPHEQVVQHVIDRDPWVVSTLGVTAVSGGVNPESLDYFGHAAGFQVYGREAGASRRRVNSDQRSFTWFVTERRGSGQDVDGDSRQRLARAVAADPGVRLERSWALPSGGTLDLYRQTQPALEVSLLATPISRIELARVDLSAKVRPGTVVPVTYMWTGPLARLKPGLVIVTWASVDAGLGVRHTWTHDHGLAFGSLRESSTASPDVALAVRERTAMWVPADLPIGRYRLVVEYLDRRTPDVAPQLLVAPELVVEVALDAPIPPRVELDMVTQLRQLASGLALGPPGVARLFDDIGRLDQYDPVQDYFDQAAVAASARLARDPTDLASGYTLLLARALQRRTAEARSAAQRVAVIDNRNPYPHVLEAVIDLYEMRPGPAAAALDRATARGASDPEIHALRAAAAFMRVNLVQAWREVQIVRSLAKKPARR
jgi:4-amino-4-deoxy-L-arabinose transferase-like glycosyltransferase